MRLTGFEVRRLMRQHGVTIRAIKEHFDVTLKRTREVREVGISGFGGDEWFRMITGRWPDEAARGVPACPPRARLAVGSAEGTAGGQRS